MIKVYGRLHRSKLTWLDRYGTRCFADFCYRECRQENASVEVLAVVTERADNPGMNITDSASEVVEAVISHFPEKTKIVVSERYDRRSFPGLETETHYGLFRRTDTCKSVHITPIPESLSSFLDKHWNDSDIR